MSKYACFNNWPKNIFNCGNNKNYGPTIGELRAAGFSQQDARAAIGQADEYFTKCLGIGSGTIKNYPGNRTGR